MIRVAYFSNQFADRCGHGLARFSRELFSALCALGNSVEIRPVAAWSSMPTTDLTQLKKTAGLKLLPTKRRLTPLLWTFLDAPSLELFLGETIDVVHAVSLGYPVATRKPYVVTVHDLGPLTHPEFFRNTRPWIMQRSLDQAVQKAAAIICVSQSTANELLDYVGSPIQDRVHIVPEGVSAFFYAPSDAQCLDDLQDLPDSNEPFILAAGKISPRKNVQGLFKAMSELGNRVPHHLVLVGGRGWETESVLQGLKDPNLAKRTHLLNYVTDEQLRALYAKACVYVHPSFYEGFGLTVLEAMAAGCPVITSNAYSLPQVAGDAAVLVDPADTAALADAIERVGSDEVRRSELARRGKERAAGFRWEYSAKRMLDIYRQVARKPSFPTDRQ